MVELHNGCICCTLRGDLLKTVRDDLYKNRSSRKTDSQEDKSSSGNAILFKIVSENPFSGKNYFYTIASRELSESDEAYDYLVIESTGIAEPLPVAQGGNSIEEKNLLYFWLKNSSRFYFELELFISVGNLEQKLKRVFKQNLKTKYFLLNCHPDLCHGCRRHVHEPRPRPRPWRPR